MADDAKRTAAPYVPFKSFLTSLEMLGSTTPHRIDRSLWPSFSGGMTSQLLIAFRFLGLIDETGKPQPSLHQLIEHPETRQKTMQEVMKKAYADVVALGLAKASPKQLDDAIAQYGLSGNTHRKAVSFFLQAAKYSDLPLSQHLGRQTRTRSRRKAVKARNGHEVERTVAAASAPQGTTRTIKLRSGEGTVSLTINFDAFTISAEDRDFVFKSLIDRLNAYESAANGKPTPVSARRIQPQQTEEPPEITDDDIPF